MKLLFLMAAAVSAMYAQTISGSIVGTVLDSSGNSIAGASVKLISERTGEERSAPTNDAGDFLFPALQPGAYTIAVEQPGFRPFRKTGNQLSAAERLSVGTLSLQVGSVNESITVAAQGVSVQTSSSENSALISSKQLEQISIRGRDVVSMLRILPGVSQTQHGRRAQQLEQPAGRLTHRQRPRQPQYLLQPHQHGRHRRSEGVAQ
jgi:hypothetical protein